METWNERLAQALAESPYSPHALAVAIGVSAPTVAAWIGAANIKPAKNILSTHLWEACKKLNVRPEWVLYGRGKRYATKHEPPQWKIVRWEAR